jgi:integrase
LESASEAGLRYRGVNQCRHTFASRLLTTGKYPEKWIADYLGHTSTAMLHKHYGKMIKQDRPDLEDQAFDDLAIGLRRAKVA